MTITYTKSFTPSDAARQWLEGRLSAPDLFSFSWQTITAFLRISTNARAFTQPFTIAEATAIAAEWLERPQSVVLAPGERHWEILSGLLTTGQATGPLVMDAHLAALSIEHGCILATTDRDFARFPDLRTTNPLARE